MMRKTLVNVATVFIIALLGYWIMSEGAKHRYKGEVPPFAQAVDLTAIESIAVHTEGRLNSFASHARTMMQYVSGPHKINGQSPSFTYLDMMFRPDHYHDEDVIYVKNKVVRGRLADALRAASNTPDDPEVTSSLDAFVTKGLIAPSVVQLPVIQAELEVLSSDLVRTAGEVQKIDSALSVTNPQTLFGTLAVIPPQGDDVMQPWGSVLDLMRVQHGQTLAGLTPESQGVLYGSFAKLEQAWVKQDAEAVKAITTDLANALRSLNPTLYPAVDRLAWERWYFAANNLTWIWLIYLLSIAVLLMSVVYRWRGASYLGFALFLVAFGFHTFAVGLRWYVSGRWPNSNMFEAVTTSVWFGGCAAIILEIVARKTAMRSVFLLGSAVSSMVALMCAHFMPVDLNANISNMMPVLHDVWLYIHTNVIIFSYCLIAMAAVSALLYLRHRLMGGEADFARVGGAGSLVMSAPGLGSAPIAGGGNEVARRASAGVVFDGATMVLMELSFILLWAGLVMGAIWADHSWGRPWGWDPKEVFALNTFIIFALLIHVRLKAKDKGLWTAILAVIGAAVMLFNWIVINFHIVGLHSYA